MSIWIMLLFWTAVAVICAGIWNEEKLIRFERGVVAGVKQTVKDWRDGHG